VHSSGWWLGSAGIALVLVVCGAICVAARKYRPQDSTAAIRVVGRVSLSPKHSIFLVKAGPRILLIGTGSQGAPNLLGELFDDEPSQPAPGSARGDLPTDFPEIRSVGSADFRISRGLDVRLGEQE
jgi:hypothetical protein